MDSVSDEASEAAQTEAEATPPLYAALLEEGYPDPLDGDVVARPDDGEVDVGP